MCGSSLRAGEQDFMAPLSPVGGADEPQFEATYFCLACAGPPDELHATIAKPPTPCNACDAPAYATPRLAPAMLCGDCAADNNVCAGCGAPRT